MLMLLYIGYNRDHASADRGRWPVYRALHYLTQNFETTPDKQADHQPGEPIAGQVSARNW